MGKFIEQVTRTRAFGERTKQVDETLGVGFDVARRRSSRTEDVHDAGIVFAVDEDVARGQHAVVVAALSGITHCVSDTSDDVCENFLTELSSGGLPLLQGHAVWEFTGIELIFAAVRGLIERSDAVMADGGLDALT